MKKLPSITKLLTKSENSKKIYLYFSKKTAGDDFDTYEQNYTYTNLNPIIIKGYVRQLSSNALVWKPYGLKETGALELICEKRYLQHLKRCNKVTIDGNDYEIYKESENSRMLITETPYQMIRAILSKI